MSIASKTENALKATLYIDINAELKELLGQAADKQEMPLNAFIARILARYVKRPDLAKIPKSKMGRPRKSLISV